MKFHLVQSARRGECQFESIARNISNARITKRKISSLHLRKRLARYVEKDSSEDEISFIWNSYEKYATKPCNLQQQRLLISRDLQKGGNEYWGDEFTLRILSRMYNVGFVIFQRSGRNWSKYLTIDESVKKRFIPLSFSNEHYDSLSITFGACKKSFWVSSKF